MEEEEEEEDPATVKSSKEDHSWDPTAVPERGFSCMPILSQTLVSMTTEQGDKQCPCFTQHPYGACPCRCRVVH